MSALAQTAAFARPLLQSARLTVIMADDALSILLVRGHAVDPARRGQPLTTALPFLCGLEAALRDIAHARRPALDLPRIDPSAVTPGIDGYVSLHACRSQDRAGVILMIQDVSAKAEADSQRLQQRNELERLRRQLQDATAEAQAANRAKSTFLAHVSHELKTPLAVITGNADILAQLDLATASACEREELAREVRLYAEDIRASGEFLARMISDLLDMVRAETGRFPMAETTFELAGLVHEAVASLENLPEAAGMALLVAADVPVLDVHGDPTRLRQVLINLLTNAIHASSPGSTTTIDWALDDAGGLILRVRDQGRGLPDSLRDQLFDPFVTGGKGSGLGLNIAATLVELHGGRIGIDAQPQGGSLAWFTLPPERVTSS